MSDRIRARKFNITVNPNAKCYDNLDFIIKALDSKEYFYIKHYKEEFSGQNNINHYHIVLEFNNPRSLKAIDNAFSGGHVEVCKFYYQSIKYLIHQRESDKQVYNVNEIKSNLSIEQINYYLQNDEHIKLDTESLLDFINNGNMFTWEKCIEHFGLHQVNLHQNLITKLVSEEEIKRAYTLLCQNYDSIQKENIILQNRINFLEDENKSLREQLDGALPF